MIAEKKITICGHDVRLRYCAAAETGYEQLSGKSIAEINFNSQEDLIRLSLAAIIAAYMSNGEESPVTSNDILFDAKPNELLELFTAVISLRAEWYGVSAVVKSETDGKGQKPKNSPQPTRSSKK